MSYKQSVNQAIKYKKLFCAHVYELEVNKHGKFIWLVLLKIVVRTLNLQINVLYTQMPCKIHCPRVVLGSANY